MNIAVDISLKFVSFGAICAFLLSLFLVRKETSRPPKLKLVSLIGILLFVLLPFHLFSIGGSVIGFALAFLRVGVPPFLFCYLLSILLCIGILHLLKYQNVSKFALFSHIVVCDVILGFLHLLLINYLPNIALVFFICAPLLSLFLVINRPDRPPKLKLVSLIGVLLFVLLSLHFVTNESRDVVVYVHFDLMQFVFFACLFSTLLCTVILYLLKYKNALRFVLFSHIVILDMIFSFLLLWVAILAY